jgi:hypothetical protein
VTGQFLQFGGSLLAILALAWFARRLGLGGETRIHDEAHLHALADEALSGFEPVEVALDHAGQAALARDGAGRVMLLRRHGSHFAARLLGPGARADSDGDTLTVNSGERQFGAVTLVLDNADAWAARLARL